MKTMYFTKNSNTTLKLMLAILALSIVGIAQAQNKYIDKAGQITFEASEALFEPVKATNAAATVILNVETNEIASLALMKGFRFKNSLMEEHFNENYIESETYPKAKFKGKLLHFNYSDLSTDITEVEVEGVLTLHGKEKPVKTTLKLNKSDSVINMVGSFTTTPADFGIEIPSIVRNKIAKEVIVTMDFKLEAK